MCVVDGCDNKVRSANAKYCEKHYGRIRRGKPLSDPIYGRKSSHTGGYVLIYVPDHPLREGKRRKTEYEHRVVFYNANGVGPFECHVCGATVGWDVMHVDHLNDDVKDNRLSNLKAACPTCNQWRGKEKMTQTHRSKSNYQIEWDSQTKCLSEWAEIVGITKVGLRERLKRGWSVERALTTPAQNFKGPRGTRQSKGYSFAPDGRKKPWIAKIYHEGRTIRLGAFALEEGAANARKKAEQKYGYLT
jgi:5-methylcytosine-specific restriction endonuclease McrA